MYCQEVLKKYRHIVPTGFPSCFHTLAGIIVKELLDFIPWENVFSLTEWVSTVYQTGIGKERNSYSKQYFDLSTICLHLHLYTCTFYTTLFFCLT